MGNAVMCDNQAEAGIIATLVYHPEFILHTDYLKPRYFYNVENGCLYWSIQELYKNGIETIDAVNITNMINSNKAVKKVIDQYNLSNIQEFITMSKYAARHTIEEYKLLVSNVITMAFKRDLEKSCVEIETMCGKDDIGLGTLNDLVNTKINKLVEQYLVSDEIQTIGAQIDELWEDVKAKRNENGVCGIPSKFSLLSDYFTYEKTELVLLTARMKRGKSMFFLNEAMYQLRHGVPVLYLDTEMSTQAFMLRALANLTGISVKDIKTGNYESEQETVINRAIAFLKKAPLVHRYVPQVSDEEIYSICKILKYKMDLQIVIYDYIKDNNQSSTEQYNLLGQKTDFLKNKIAGELELSVIAGAQKNRMNEIADSDKIARYVSTVIDWREKTSEEIAKDGGLDYGNFAMGIPINRNGAQTGEGEYISMHFDGDHARIEQAKQPTNAASPF